MNNPIEIRFLEFLEPKYGLDKDIPVQRFIDFNLNEIEKQESISDFLNDLKHKDFIDLTGDRVFDVGWRHLESIVKKRK